MSIFEVQRRLGLLLFSIVVLAVTDANAQLTISWHTIDGGGGHSSGGLFSLDGTIGQHDASTEMTGGSFSLTGGFWAGISNDSVLLGDVNMDGVVNLLDVAPFVAAISNGDFIAEADINGDGVVNLLDVQPFVDLLSG